MPGGSRRRGCCNHAIKSACRIDPDLKNRLKSMKKDREGALASKEDSRYQIGGHYGTESACLV